MIFYVSYVSEIMLSPEKLMFLRNNFILVFKVASRFLARKIKSFFQTFNGVKIEHNIILCIQKYKLVVSFSRLTCLLYCFKFID